MQIASPWQSNELTDWSAVKDTFDSIASNLNVTHTTTNFTLVTAKLDTGTKVRMTFDPVTGDDRTTSDRYFEGTVTKTGSTYTFGSITYGGGLYGSTVGAGPITGTLNGTEINFAFGDFIGYNSSSEGKNNIRQWLLTPSDVDWWDNSEYSADGASSTNTEKCSAVIYLVLDCSTSLNENQIGQIRSAAISFINSLYDKYNANY